MKATRFIEEQIVKALIEVETIDQQRKMRVSVAAWHLWTSKYGGREINEASRFNEKAGALKP